MYILNNDDQQFQKYQQNEELSNKYHDISLWKSGSCSGTFYKFIDMGDHNRF